MIIATFAEATVIRPHTGTSRLKVINQVGESVAFVRSSDGGRPEHVNQMLWGMNRVKTYYFRNDSMKSENFPSALCSVGEKEICGHQNCRSIIKARGCNRQTLQSVLGAERRGRQGWI